MKMSAPSLVFSRKRAGGRIDESAPDEQEARSADGVRSDGATNVKGDIGGDGHVLRTTSVCDRSEASSVEIGVTDVADVHVNIIVAKGREATQATGREATAIVTVIDGHGITSSKPSRGINFEVKAVLVQMVGVDNQVILPVLYVEVRALLDVGRSAVGIEQRQDVGSRENGHIDSAADGVVGNIVEDVDAGPRGERSPNDIIDFAAGEFDARADITQRVRASGVTTTPKSTRRQPNR